jgi:hypothetical protein
MVFFGEATSPVVWRTKQQDIVAQSMTEAELIGMNETKNEMLFCYELLSECQVPMRMPMRMYGDNQGALAIAVDAHSRQRTKHMARRWYSIRECLTDGPLTVEYCSTHRMVANMMTKPIPVNEWMQYPEFVAVQMSMVMEQESACIVLVEEDDGNADGNADGNTDGNTDGGEGQQCQSIRGLCLAGTPRVAVPPYMPWH